MRGLLPNAFRYSAAIRVCEMGPYPIRCGINAGAALARCPAQRCPLQRGHQRMRDGTVADPARHQRQAPRARGVLPNFVRYNAAISACEMGL